jgi:hypothetical protein
MLRLLACGRTRVKELTNHFRSGHQSFRYLTPKARISPSDIFRDTSFSSPVPPSYIHFVCSPLRAREIIDETKGLGWKDAGLVWEPMPSDCVPCELENLRSVAREVTVISYVSSSHLPGPAVVWADLSTGRTFFHFSFRSDPIISRPSLFFPSRPPPPSWNSSRRSLPPPRLSLPFSLLERPPSLGRVELESVGQPSLPVEKW